MTQLIKLKRHKGFHVLQSISVLMPLLAQFNWPLTTVQTHCRGQVYLCRYADDFVCAFEYEKDAQCFYEALEKRLNKFNLEVAENKTHLLVFSRCKIRNGASFNFLGFP